MKSPLREVIEYIHYQKSFGIKSEIILIVTPKEITIQKIKTHKENHQNDITLDDQMAKHYCDYFQRLTANEGDTTVVKGY